MGVIGGGWEFVIAAYVVTAAVLGGYLFSLLSRLRGEMRRAEREDPAR